MWCPEGWFRLPSGAVLNMSRVTFIHHVDEDGPTIMVGSSKGVVLSDERDRDAVRQWMSTVEELPQ